MDANPAPPAKLPRVKSAAKPGPDAATEALGNASQAASAINARVGKGFIARVPEGVTFA